METINNILAKFINVILEISYPVALLGAGIAILFGIIGFKKYYKVAGAFFLGYVVINYLLR